MAIHGRRKLRRAAHTLKSSSAIVGAASLAAICQRLEQQAQSANPVIHRFLGTKGDFGRMLKLNNRWAFNIVKQVGNYGESFERNLTPLGLDRGINKLWNKGGLMYSPPLR